MIDSNTKYCEIIWICTKNKYFEAWQGVLWLFILSHQALLNCCLYIKIVLRTALKYKISQQKIILWDLILWFVRRHGEESPPSGLEMGSFHPLYMKQRESKAVICSFLWKNLRQGTHGTETTLQCKWDSSQKAGSSCSLCPCGEGGNDMSLNRRSCLGSTLPVWGVLQILTS